jgi:hypothetical protein
MLGRYEAAREECELCYGDIAMKWQAQYLAVQCQVHLIDQAPTSKDRIATVNACHSTIAELIQTVTITNLIPSLHALRDLVLSKMSSAATKVNHGKRVQTQSGRRSDEERRAQPRRSPVRPERRRRTASSSGSRSRSRSRSSSSSDSGSTSRARTKSRNRRSRSRSPRQTQMRNGLRKSTGGARSVGGTGNAASPANPASAASAASAVARGGKAPTITPIRNQTEAIAFRGSDKVPASQHSKGSGSPASSTIPKVSSSWSTSTNNNAVIANGTAGSANETAPPPTPTAPAPPPPPPPTSTVKLRWTAKELRDWLIAAGASLYTQAALSLFDAGFTGSMIRNLANGSEEAWFSALQGLGVSNVGVAALVRVRVLAD